jgi:hypothetical protein
MIKTSQWLSIAPLVVLASSAAVAESPVVLNIRQMVSAIDASIGSKKGTTVDLNLEGPNGINKFVADQNAEAVSITYWGSSYGGVVKATASFGGEFESTEALFYWSVNGNLVQKPLFAFMRKTYRDNKNKAKRTEELRCYFENGKAKVFRIGTRTVSLSDRRCKSIVKSMNDSLIHTTPGD